MRMFKTCSFEFSVQASVHYSQATTQLFVRYLLFLLQTQAQVQLSPACNFYCKHKQQKAARSLEMRRYTNTVAMQVLLVWDSLRMLKYYPGGDQTYHRLYSSCRAIQSMDLQTIVV